MLEDNYGRTIRYLRLSVTAACQMTCSYCRPAHTEHQCDSSALSSREIERLVEHLVRRHGLRKVRLTGGEPTARPDLLDIVERLGAIKGLEDLAMTSNGITLPRMAQRLAAAGLTRVNISLDSLDRECFQRMTGRDCLDLVLTGIDAARAAGLGPIKVNTVVLRDQNDAELPALVRFAAHNDLIIRFIELMPMGPLASQWEERYVSTDEMLDRLQPIIAESETAPEHTGAARYRDLILTDGTRTRVGFISAVSCPFCAGCDRLRLTANGDVYPCLMDSPALNILPAVRPTFDPVLLDALLDDALQTKVEIHPAAGVGVMTQLGG